MALAVNFDSALARCMRKEKQAARLPVELYEKLVQ